MNRLKIALKNDRKIKILCLGAHSDDIEIGCGGTILRIIKEYECVEANWIVFSSGNERKLEAEKSACLFLENAKYRNIKINSFRDGFFPYDGCDIKEYFEKLKEEICPDLIFTHYRQDLHQDHRLISELTWNTFRNHLILEYEIIKYDGDLGTPNVFVNLNESLCLQKVNFIMNSYKSQLKKGWFTPDAFISILRIRGIESNSPDRFSEGFYCRKISL